jgi:hypothetical protein
MPSVGRPHRDAEVERETLGRKTIDVIHEEAPNRDTLCVRLSARTRPALNTRRNADAVPWHSGKRRTIANERLFEYDFLPDQRLGGELTAGSQVTTRREAQTVALGGLSTHSR